MTSINVNFIGFTLFFKNHNCIEELKRQLASKTAMEAEFEEYKLKTKSELCKTNSRCQNLQTINEYLAKQNKLLETKHSKAVTNSAAGAAAMPAPIVPIGAHKRDASMRRTTSTLSLHAASNNKKSRWNPSTLLIEN